LENCGPESGYFEKDREVERQILRYARFLARRGLVSHTLGNIAVRIPHPGYPKTGVAYAKARGVSLEEMQLRHVAVTEIETDRLIAGETPPSLGHQLARAIFLYRPEVNAVIHTHSDIIIAYFSQTAEEPFRFVSVDTPLVLGTPIRVLPKGVNVESDARSVETLLGDTNCFVMPNHGLTTLGRTLSEAYHRHTAFLSEVARVITATMVAQGKRTEVCWVSDSDTNRFYELGDRIIYGIA